MFIKEIINLESNYFNELNESSQFTDICTGRKGAVLVEVCQDSSQIPLVRSTTKFNVAVQKFAPIHHILKQKINNKLLKNFLDGQKILDFNNALVEIYETNYKNMKFHSDQSLDLKENSLICIFSCYENQNANRILEIKNKDSGKNIEIFLDHNSIVFFPLVTNSKNLHKIKLQTKSITDKKDKWLGITFRLSKTFIKFECNESNILRPLLIDLNKELRIANKVEEREFYILRKRENIVDYFLYPKIEYTISPGDLINVK
jgi:hypothetical protein